MALGGGTGLPILLSGLKQCMFADAESRRSEQDRDRLIAIVATADDGGSSGRLRSAYGVLPPGDLRSCLLALSGGDPRLAALLNFRFPGDGELGGHSLGNLVLTALNQIHDDLPGAIEWLSGVLEVHGRVLPASIEPLTLCAEYGDGGRKDGESRIATAGRRIVRVSIRPAGPRALPQAVRAIHRANLVVIGPGSLYTSLLPILLIPGIETAIQDSKARVVLVLNLMTEPGETEGYSAADFISAFRLHAPRVAIHDVLINSAPLREGASPRIGAGGPAVVAATTDSLRFQGCAPIQRDLIAKAGPIRHHPGKLGRAVLQLAEAEMRCTIQG